MDREFAGARWWRFDFHAHTPFSRCTAWSAAGEASTMTAETWLRRYMQAQIDCVAITDHNGAGWVQLLREAYRRLETEQPGWFRRLALFPGVELSVNGGFHVLAIFDPGADSGVVDDLLAQVRYQGRKGDSDGCSEASLADVLVEVSEQGGIAIPAHVDRPKGLLQIRPDAPGQSVADPLTLAQALDCPTLFAMEVVTRDAPMPQLYMDRRLRWTPVLGSDTHGNEGDDLPAVRFTWVKMGAPTLEGLRLALLDGSPLSVRRSDDPDTGDPNAHARLAIERLDIRDARVAGRGAPLSAEFSPWLSALVGGRGSGKSTIIEMLRLALRREPELQGDLAERFAAFNRVAVSRDDSGAMRSDTDVVAILRKDGGRFRVTWRQDGQGPIIEEERSGEWVAAEGDPRARFPVRLFSQKQVASLAESPDALLRLVDDSPDVGRADWEREWREAEARFLRLRSERRELEARLSVLPRLSGELADARRQLAVFEAGGHRELLVDYQRSRRQQRVVEDRAVEMERSEQQLRQVAASLTPTDVAQESFSASDGEDQSAVTLLAEAASHQQSIVARVSELADDVAAYRNGWMDRVGASAWAGRNRETARRYEELVTRLAGEGISDPTAYGALVQRTQALERQVGELNDLRARILELESRAQTELDSLEALRRELSVRRSTFLETITRDNAFVRIQVVPLGDAAATAEPVFRTRLNREDGRLERDILADDQRSGILAELYRDLPSGEARTPAILARVMDLKRHLSGQAGFADLNDRSEWFRKHLKSLLPEQIDRIQTWWPEDSLKVQYRRGGATEQFVSIEQGSPGQKSAAVLAFVLSYGTEPIVLDQPEDDLDNRLVYDLIVEQIRHNKQKRQIIVATHNPNIVVNGDAEMVISMDFAGGQCVVTPDATGCLQEEGVRAGICRVMEGGRKAFEERYRRIRLSSESRHV